MALLALFWVTHWGEQRIDVELYNRAQLEHGMADALKRQVKELELTIERLMTLADFGSANDPSTSFGHRASNPAARMSPASLRLSCLTPVVQPGHLATVTRSPSAPRNDTQLNPASL